MADSNWRLTEVELSDGTIKYRLQFRLKHSKTKWYDGAVLYPTKARAQSTLRAMRENDDPPRRVTVIG